MMDGNVSLSSWMLGCALLLWLCWWNPLNLPGPTESHGVCRSYLWIPKGLLCVTKLWGVGHASSPSGTWEVGKLPAFGHGGGEGGAVNCTLGLGTNAPLQFYFSWSKCFFGPRPTLSLLCPGWPVYIVVALLGIKSLLSLICFEYLKVLKMISVIQGNWFEEEIIQSCLLFQKCFCACLWMLYMTWLAVAQHSLLILLV